MEYIKELIDTAIKSRQLAYTPYSNFKVGAALLTSDKKIYGGCNVENASYSVCNCAERTALFRAIFDGYNKFEAIAVVGGNSKEKDFFSSYCPPCGVCRQALREFCNPNEFRIILARSTDDFKVFTLSDLLPESFGPEQL